MAITLDQARERIGAGVVYRTLAQREGRDGRAAEDGTIERVGEQYVFVRYGRNSIMATDPADLDWLTP